MEQTGTITRMGRKKTIEKTVLLRLLPGQHAAIQSALSTETGETLAQWLRAAVTEKLERQVKRPPRRRSRR